MVEFSRKHLTKITMKPQTNAKVKSVPAGFITEKKRVLKLIYIKESVDVELNQLSNSFKTFINGILLFMQLLISQQITKNNRFFAHYRNLLNPIQSYVLVIGERYKN